jgi:hypothetical protein
MPAPLSSTRKNLAPGADTESNLRIISDYQKASIAAFLAWRGNRQTAFFIVPQRTDDA